ncbi:MFS transporter [Methylovirgula sp. HY1]|uniref:MFS transporter n=1 Tax=Methylovirgula sp. HY1 TaxID=2822761 RepID=UPI001C5AAC0F|nr:MFS transporter [Methylovirgula sp. HY1]QXX74570.1 Fosmidomycin resistance protein [Methylovirgula sp. HY1]
MDAKIDAPYRPDTGESTLFVMLVALSFAHLLNDTVQSLLPAIYPIIKASYALDFGQIGLITLSFQLTASFLQPFVGLYTDRHPRPYSLAIGMGFTLCGLLLLAVANHFTMLLAAAALVGVGSSVFHPEASRIARMASGGQHGLAQSLFQVGGSLGAATGPLLAAFIVVPHGQKAIAWLALVPLLAMVLLSSIGNWYARQLALKRPRSRSKLTFEGIGRRKVVLAILILLALVFSKFVYLASLSSYYTFYLIQKFHVSVPHAQILLFLFLGASALGTFLGGPIGDRIGRRYVIFGSILGVLPFTLALPYANLFFTAVLTVIIGLILSSAFASILVYAQELLPGRVGTVAGLFFGFAFGMGGLGAALLGMLADQTSISFVYHVSAFLPAIGLLAYFLPGRLPQQ